MQTQQPHYNNMPPQHNMVGTAPGGYQQQANTNPPPPQVDMTGPFSHLLQLPIFQIFSLEEFNIIRQRIQENIETKKLRADVLANKPPPPTTADAMTAKVVMEYLSILSDGGITFVATRINIDTLMNGTLALVEASERQAMTPSALLVYSRWASPRERPGPPILVDVLAWYKLSDRSCLTGVMVKANTEQKIRVNGEKAFSVKEGKKWDKTWFRGRPDSLEIVVGDKAGEVRLGQVMAVERTLIPAVYGDFLSRWKAYVVPKPATC